MTRLIIGMSGSSGVIYGIRMLEVLAQHKEIETHLIMSQSARLNIGIETDWKVEDVEALADVVHNNKNIAASISSGSFKTAGMIVAPCSMKTLSGIVNSYADNLLIRAADVVLKERRKLILVPREAPYSEIHLEHMLKLTRMGAVVIPASPGFYNRPQSVEDMVDFVVARILSQIGLPQSLVPAWGA